ncbi:MAG: DNA-directed RNA polymerase subunit B, partial [Candidatus Diapherotrites archaeon]|nr:DNA-directed RNA polymerase subunit B [Candidatus Diapherotrites archaeon]
MSEDCLIYVNGTPVGTHNSGSKLVELMRKKRREGKLTRNTSVTFYKDKNEVLINTDGGRIVRPVI